MAQIADIKKNRLHVPRVLGRPIPSEWQTDAHIVLNPEDGRELLAKAVRHNQEEKRPKLHVFITFQVNAEGWPGEEVIAFTGQETLTWAHDQLRRGVPIHRALRDGVVIDPDHLVEV